MFYVVLIANSKTSLKKWKVQTFTLFNYYAFTFIFISVPYFNQIKNSTFFFINTRYWGGRKL